MPATPVTSARRMARERLLQWLYCHRITGQWGSLEDLSAVFGVGEEATEQREDRSFSRRLAEVLQMRLSEIDSLIESASRNWRLERMAAVDLSVLRMATAELLLEAAPDRVVINEAVEIAKRYGTETSAPFVNGVLDGLRRTLRQPVA